MPDITFSPEKPTASHYVPGRGIWAPLEETRPFPWAMFIECSGSFCRRWFWAWPWMPAYSIIELDFDDVPYRSCPVCPECFYSRAHVFL